MNQGQLAARLPQRVSAALTGLVCLALGLLVLLSEPTAGGQLALGLVGFAIVGGLALRRSGALRPAAGAVRPGVVTALRRRRAEHQAPLRLHDPDAPGRSRPRAPGERPAA